MKRSPSSITCEGLAALLEIFNKFAADPGLPRFFTGSNPDGGTEGGGHYRGESSGGETEGKWEGRIIWCCGTLFLEMGLCYTICRYLYGRYTG